MSPHIPIQKETTGLYIKYLLCKSFGFCSSVDEASVLLGHDAASLSVQFLMLQDNMVISPSRHNISKHPTPVEETHHPHCYKNLRLLSFSMFE